MAVETCTDETYSDEDKKKTPKQEEEDVGIERNLEEVIKIERNRTLPFLLLSLPLVSLLPLLFANNDYFPLPNQYSIFLLALIRLTFLSSQSTFALR